MSLYNYTCLFNYRRTRGKFEDPQLPVLWSKNLKLEYEIKVPIWGIAAAPLVVDNLVIVHVGGKDNACLIAFNKVTGDDLELLCIDLSIGE